METFESEMKNLLEEERKNIIEKLKDNQESFKDENVTQGDDCDLASSVGDNSKREIFGALYEKKIKAIDGALKRISDGKYGYCLQCGKKIPEGRLRAMPTAVLCVDCQAEKERFSSGN